jgi:N-acetylmuramoyl-L-alanine amidase
VCVVLTAGLVFGRSLEAQGRPRFQVEREDGSSDEVAVELDRGYAAVPVAVLETLGWSVRESGGSLDLSAGDVAVSMSLDSPFFRWDDVVLQLTDPPYRTGSRTFVPLQFFTDFLPRRLPDVYEFVADRSLLRAGDVHVGRSGSARSQADRRETADEASVERRPTAEDVRNAGPSEYEGVRVVIIDAGHGGVDPGALGPDGIREKEVALGVSLRLAERLRQNPDLEVHLIRDDDTFVDLWKRGQIATRMKGQRPGIFVSIHANSFPRRRSAQGFETYFLSDARTEHERRVSAIENAPLSMNPERVGDGAVEDIDFILRDLKNYDHAHWSEDLASLVQAELEDVHPGPNRGVKQGVLAVLTNALMPSVLVELGYLSNDSEGHLLGREAFQDDAAGALAEAVERFFERYPPGNGLGSQREEP